MTTTAREARRNPKIREQRRAQARRRRVRLFARAREIMEDLIAKLGSECVKCGERGETAALSIDHVVGITWPHRYYNYYQRACRYLDEYRRGVPLRVLCIPCNSAQGRPEPEYEPAPF